VGFVKESQPTIRVEGKEKHRCEESLASQCDTYSFRKKQDGVGKAWGVGRGGPKRSKRPKCRKVHALNKKKKKGKRKS